MFDGLAMMLRLFDLCSQDACSCYPRVPDVNVTLMRSRVVLSAAT